MTLNAIDQNMAVTNQTFPFKNSKNQLYATYKHALHFKDIDYFKLNGRNKKTCFVKTISKKLYHVHYY